MQNFLETQNNGYIALVTVLIITAVTLMIAISVNLESMGETKISLAKNQSSKAFYLATACAEDALMKLKDNLNYGGDEILTFTQGTCTILPVEGVGNQNRLIKVIGNVSNYTRRIRIEISRVNPDMEISSWQEVTGF